MKILIVEDDYPLLETLVFILGQNGYEITTATNLHEAKDILYENSDIDMLLLDINIPYGSGYDILKYARTLNANMQVIFMTSNRDKEKCEEAYSLNCDDYIRKPFDIDELLARITTVLRRNNQIENYYFLIDHNLKFDFINKKLLLNDKEIPLKSKLLKLLMYFLKNTGRLCTKDEISYNVWGYDNMPSDSSIRVHVKDLRKIIGAEHIKTIINEGYKFEVA